MILSIQNLSTKFEPHLQDVSFDVKEGEIFGLYGLVGAGRTELLETIFGVRTRAAGRVYFNNRLMNFSSAKEAMEHGFAMITEERKANGLFLKGDLTFNYHHSQSAAVYVGYSAFRCKDDKGYVKGNQNHAYQVHGPR